MLSSLFTVTTENLICVCELENVLNVASQVILSLSYNICIQKLIISAHKQCFTYLPLPL